MARGGFPTTPFCCPECPMSKPATGCQYFYMGRKFVDGEKRNIQTLPVPSLLSDDDHGEDGGIASEDDKDESDNNKKDQGLQGKGQQ